MLSFIKSTRMKSMISLLLLLFVVCSTIGAQKSDPNDRRLKVYKPSDTCRTVFMNTDPVVSGNRP